MLFSPNCNIHVPPTSVPLGKGKLLVSAPLMTDDYFSRTVVLLVEQDAQGAFGFILNRPMRVYLGNVLPDAGKHPFVLYNGGPVELNKLFFLHTHGHLIEDAVPVGNGLYFGGNERDLYPLLQEELLDDEGVRFFVGYAAWGPGQLENELKEKAWVVAECPYENMLEPDECLWQGVVESLGRPYAHWLEIPDEAFNR